MDCALELCREGYYRALAEIRELFAVTAWAIWYWRDKEWANESEAIPPNIDTWALNYLVDFQSVRNKSPTRY